MDIRGCPRPVRAADGIWEISMGKEENISGRNYGGVAKLLHHSASVSIRGRPRCVWTEGASWAIISKKTEKPKRKTLGWRKYCIRKPPLASLDILGRPRRVWAEDRSCGIIRGGNRAKTISGRNYDGVAELLLPPATVDIRDVCGRKMERGGIIRQNPAKMP